VGPKRRSCVACTESKTKCDREQPCNRCAAKSRDCIYPKPKLRKNKHSSGVAFVSQTGESSRSTVDPIEEDIPALESTFNNYRSIPEVTNSNSSWTETTETLTGLDVPVSADFASMYHGDVFESLFSDVFGQSAPDIIPGATSFFDASTDVTTIKGSSEGFPFSFSVPQKPTTDYEWKGSVPASSTFLTPQDNQDLEINQYCELNTTAVISAKQTDR